MNPITISDLTLINNLSNRRYPGKSLTPNTTNEEQNQFNHIKIKLRNIAEYFANKYNASYGPFETNVSPEANPVTRGHTLHDVWSTFFKGAQNKQYSAQISFVIDRESTCLNVGFYFGRASGHGLNQGQREILENILNNLGQTLSNMLTNNIEFQNNFNSLFDFGFSAYSSGSVLPNNWIIAIANEPKNSQITAKVYPNEFGIIEISTLDFYVSQVVFLMAAFQANNLLTPTIKPLTPQQYAKQAERRAQIGLEGELFIMRNETLRLQLLGITEYPRHVALESNHYGYDILSLDNNGNEIFMEIKSTTRKSQDNESRKFFLTNHELEIFNLNQERYRLVRVYDVENNPHSEELNLNELTRLSNGYIVVY